MEYLSDLTTPEAVTRQLEKAVPGSAPEPATDEYNDYYDFLTLNAIPAISAFIQSQCGRSFVPYVETRTDYFWLMLEDKRFGRGFYFLDEDLAVINSITWAGTELEATKYLPAPSNTLPYTKIMFNPHAGLFADLSNFQAGIEIDGTWGYITNTVQAYRTLIVIDEVLSDSATIIAVPDATIFETLQYLKIDEELLQVVERDLTEAANAITVLRGVNGTEAAAHASGYATRAYRVNPDIQDVATRLGAFAYQRRNDSAGRSQYVDASALLAEMPPFVAAMLSRKIRFQARVA